MAELLTVESLVKSGVLASAGDESFSLDPAFEQRVADYRDEPQQQAVEALENRFENSQHFSSLKRTDERTTRFVAQLRALGDHFEGVPLEAVVSAGFVVDQFLDGPFQEGGVPDGFVPVSGYRLAIVEEVFPGAVVYIWRHDCEPCDAMRETLESMQPRFPAGVAKFAVYGPDSARYLHEEYDVQGGPATLFVADGGIESRLYGAHYDEVIESELESLDRKQHGSEA